MEVMAVRRLRPNVVSHTDDGRLIGQQQRDDHLRDHRDSNLLHRTGIWTIASAAGHSQPGIRKMPSAESKATDSQWGDGEQKVGSGQNGRRRLDRHGQIVEERRRAGAIGDTMIAG